MDFTRRQIDILLTGDVQLDVDDNFNSIIIQTLQFRFLNQSIRHFVEYLCAAEDDCDWLYAKQKVPPLLNIDYRPLYKALEPLLYDSTSSTHVAKCYQNDMLIDCLEGMCSYLPLDTSGTPSISRSCLRYNQSELGIAIERRRIDPGPSTHDLDVFEFRCNKDQCNGPKNENDLKLVVQSYNDWIIQTENDSSSLKMAYNYIATFLDPTTYQFLNDEKLRKAERLILTEYDSYQSLERLENDTLTTTDVVSSSTSSRHPITTFQEIFLLN
ncbi:unnamed protein product [Rotaria sp. Silwood1]|nr:unnamed protein product [Rotaria sp. Silwood1]CAF1388226.1 unnamed protein product [Rotaria sp. Silwood1]CAF4781209.1 unnamed protein product [Rotaria sp. Silwood1]